MDALTVRRVAEEEYPDIVPLGPDAPMFALLVDVADAYLQELEKIAGDNPAPFLFGTTPQDCLLLGLKENLEEIREGR